MCAHPVAGQVALEEVAGQVALEKLAAAGQFVVGGVPGQVAGWWTFRST